VTIRVEEAAVLAALVASPAGYRAEELMRVLAEAGVSDEGALDACEALFERGAIELRDGAFQATSLGANALIDFHAAIEHALDPSPTTPGMEACPSVPWLTTVQTHWLDAVSLNYAVDVDAVRTLLPRPLEPEIHEGTAWVQLLVSRLREMRPQGLPPLFGVNFHQASYRVAVSYKSLSGRVRRGGYFIRSETDHGVMRALGNRLLEFRFHDFGLAKMGLTRRGERLTLSIAPTVGAPHGEVDVDFDTRPGQAAPRGSVWRSIEQVREPLVECFDAFGVDPSGWVYVLTIDREPWRERWAVPTVRRAAYFESGPLGHGAARLASALHVPVPCAYRWRPLRRERFEP